MIAMPGTSSFNRHRNSSHAFGVNSQLDSIESNTLKQARERPPAKVRLHQLKSAMLAKRAEISSSVEAKPEGNISVRSRCQSSTPLRRSLQRPVVNDSREGSKSPYQRVLSGQPKMTSQANIRFRKNNDAIRQDFQPSKDFQH